MPASDQAASMKDLQDRWYNALVAGLILDRSAAQLLQPARLLPATDTGLWASLDVLPPETLTFNTSLSQSAIYSSEYTAMASSLQVGLVPTVPRNVSADFSGTYGELVETLQNSMGVNVDFVSSGSSDTSNAWTSKNSALFGLWTGSSAASELTKIFVSSEVSVQLNCQSYAVWPAIPGDWYDSSLLNIAFTNPGVPPWPESGHPNWLDFFGVDGRLSRFLVSLLIADGLSIRVESRANYSSSQQTAIDEQVAQGLWPCFVPNNNKASTVCEFGNFGLRYETTVEPGNPIVVGGNVLDIKRYLGH